MNKTFTLKLEFGGSIYEYNFVVNGCKVQITLNISSWGKKLSSTWEDSIELARNSWRFLRKSGYVQVA